MDPSAVSNPLLVADAVEHAFAPIFLLAGVGALLGVMTARLSRVVDRARSLERAIEAGGPETGRNRAELKALGRRMIFANGATIFCAIAALLVCLVVSFLFIGGVTAWPVGGVIAALFLMTMGFLMTGLCLFLAEVVVANDVLRVRSDVVAPRERND